LQAESATGSSGGNASTPNQFGNSGFYQSVSGQAGVSGNIDASTTTLLSGGADTTSRTVTGNYGYSLTAATTNLNGTFQMQPIIVGVGGKDVGKGGIGCGGGGGGGAGGAGAGMVLIASW
jgi:hypothetical protein